MLPIECGKKHIINYTDFCCIQHLIEMNLYSESQTLSHKFGKSMLKVLNHYLRNKQLNFESIKLETLKLFLEMMTKFISHFYFMNKFEYSKLLVRIALKASEETVFKEHPDVISRRCAIYNNIACVYEKTGSFSKAIKYFKVYLKYANGRYDKLVVMNNLARIYVKLSDINSATNLMKSLYSIIKEEAKKLWSDHVKNARETISIKSQCQGETLNRVNLISFLYYNYATFLQNIGKEQDAQEKYRKGYEFTVSILGEFNILISKFAAKLFYQDNLNKVNTKTENFFRRSISNEYSSDSDIDHISMEENTNIKLSSSFNKNQEATTKHQRMDTFNTFKMVSKKNTLSTGQNFNLVNQNYQTIQNNEMNEIKQKVDILLQKFDKFDIEKLTKLLGKEEFQEKVNTSGQPKNSSKTNERKEKIIKLFKPAIKKYLVGGGDQKSLANQISMLSEEDLNRRGSINMTQDVLNELVSQFDAEIKEENSILSNSDFCPDDSLIRNTDVRNKSTGKTSVGGDPRKINSSINLQTKSRDETKEKDPSQKALNARRSLRDMFKKVLPDKAVNTIEQKNNNLNNEKRGSVFASMVSSLMDDNPVVKSPLSPKSNVSNDFSQRSMISSSNTQNTGTSQNTQLKNNNCNLPKIQINCDNSEDKYEFTTLFYKNPEVPKSEAYTKQINNFAKIFKINVILDECDKKYQPETFYIKKNSDKTTNDPSYNKNKSDPLPINSEEKINEDENSISITKDLKRTVQEIDLDSIDEDIFNRKKLKKTIDIKKTFDNLIVEENNMTKSFSIIRELNNELYKISIDYGKKEQIKGIFLRLRKLNNSKEQSVIAENFISFEKLRSFANKITLYNSLPDYYDIHMLLSLDDFIQKIFIFHCYIFSKDGTVMLGVLTRPLGICFNRAYEFTFLKTSCIIDIFIIDNNEIKFFIYNKSNDLISLSYNWILDNKCYDSLFQEFKDEMTISENEVKIKSYKTVEDKHLIKTGFITEIIVGLQKIYREEFSDKNLKFDHLVNKTYNRVQSIYVKEDFKILELTSIILDISNLELSFFYSTLKALTSNNLNKLAKNHSSSQFNFSKKFNLNDVNFNSLIPNVNLMSERDILHLNYRILNTFKLDFAVSTSNISSLKVEEIQNRLGITQIKPEITKLFYFEENKFNFKLEYFYYTNNNYFIVLNVVNKTLDLFLNKFLVCPYLATDDNLKNLMINNEEQMKKAILDFYKIWNIEEEYVLFDNFFKLSNKKL